MQFIFQHDLILFYLFSFIFNAFFTTGTASQVDIAMEKSLVESIAIDYITKYVYNSYLYEYNDLTVGTANQIFAVTKAAPIQNETLYNVNNKYLSAAALCDRMTSFKLSADYFRYIRNAQNIMRYNFSYSPNIIKSYVDNNSAYVHIYTYITFSYLPNGETSACGDNYILQFLKIDGMWYIVDVESEELLACGLTGLNESYTDKIIAFNNWMQNDTSANTITQTSRTSTYDRTYHAGNAIAYAYTYTTQSYNNISIGNNTTFLNSNFRDYSNMGGNCQNFVSQCLWAGFGGLDTAAAVNNRSFPMYDQWYDTNISDDRTASWCAVGPFYEEVISANTKFTTIYGSVNGNFAHIPLGYLPGSVLHVNPNANGYQHAVIITKASGQNF